MEHSIFVTRERELGRLEGFLDQAMAGEGSVCFVTGEAGGGKTTLVTEFARQAQRKHDDLVVAIGQSDAATGSGDPYLPFREIMGLLTGDVEAKLSEGAITEDNASRLRDLLRLSVHAIVEVGPDLIGIFVPGAGIAALVGTFVAEKAGWMDKLDRLTKKPKPGGGPAGSGLQQDQIFEQYTNVLRRLAEQRPLLLVLDDLQWADAGSTDLLFRLGRRIGGSRILIIGTYRPEEVALGRAGERHPLEKVLAELKRYQGDIRVDLDQAQMAEGRQFIDAYLDTEANHLGDHFREALFHHTGGHPLFTIELLRDMQESGDLVQDAQGRWAEGPQLSWDDLPQKVEGVIEERIGRLEDECHELLAVGSVEGESFTAEVVARVQDKKTRALILCLGRELEKQHRLVRSQGMHRLRLSGQRLSLYRFQHNLFRTYLYGELSEAERAYLHEDVGNVLEGLFGEEADEIAVQLANHFEEAGMQDKARHYLGLAGKQAAARYANDDALAFFDRALATLPHMDEPAHRSRKEILERYDLHMAREDVYTMVGGREAQRQDLTALRRIAESLDDDHRRAEVSLREARYAEMTGEYALAMQSLEEATESARLAQDEALQARAARAVGYLLWRKGDYKEARAQLEGALPLVRAAGLRRDEAEALHGLAIAHWRLGQHDEARSFALEALDLGRELGDRHVEDTVLNALGNIDLTQGNYESAKAYYEQGSRICGELGNLRGEAMSLGNLGIIAEIEGDYPRAMDRFERVGAIFRDIGDRSSEARALGHLGKNAALHGLYDQARARFEQALEIHRVVDAQQGELWVRSEYGFLLIELGDYEQAASHFKQSLHTSQELGIRSMEGQAWRGLAQIHLDLGDLDEAAVAFQKALEVRLDLGEQNLAAETKSYLALVALGRGDRAQAKVYADQVLVYLEGQSLEGVQDVFRAYLNCYRVLRALDDPRAPDLLAETYAVLQEQACKISDSDSRRAFLENVAVHREILRLWHANQRGSGEIK